MAEITAQLVKQLRERTGAGMLECKHALEEAKGDLAEAEVVLRKRGIASASKKASRATGQGVIGSYIHPGAQLGVLVEVNCESDFVARTEEFQGLVHDVAMQIAALDPRFIRREDVTPEVLQKEREIQRDRAIAEGKPPQAVAIVHCVGSRDEHYHEYCSRVCCMYSLKFAHLVKEKTGAEVYNLYIDMRTPGKGYEEFYKRLLREGVHFIRGKAAEVTDVAESPEEQGKLVVVCEDTLLGVTRRLPVDMVILSSALKARKDVDEVARLFSLSCAQGNFFLERHPKLAPVEAAADGLYLAGACQGPKDIPDSVAQGGAAAACALALMDKGVVSIEPITAEIDPDRCSGCQMCVAACPYEAIEFNKEKGVSEVHEELCKGCGTCVATCPSGVAKQKGFEDVQVYAELEGVLA